MSGISFEPVSPGQADVVAALMREFYSHFEDLHFDEEASPEAVRALADSSDLGRIWVICYDNDPIGYLALTLSFSIEFLGRVAWIDELYIREPFRGKGVGTAAIEKAFAFCGAVDVKAILLELDRVNEDAGRLYRRLGFAERDHYKTLAKSLGRP